MKPYTFVRETSGLYKGIEHARSNNPTRKVLEDRIALLEKGSNGFAFASRLAAIDAVIKLLQVGDEIIAVDAIDGGAFRQFTKIWSKFGITIHYVDTTDEVKVWEAISMNTKMIWIETPTHPTLNVTDIAAMARIADVHDILLCVDNTFATPVLPQPLLLGADIVLHSAPNTWAGTAI